MIRPIMKAPFILSQKSKPATVEDVQIARDLEETLIAHEHECVGMAANMIGVLKNIICLNDEGDYLTMFNPMIIDRKKPFLAQEGCLSLPGKRQTTRYETITVKFQDEMFIEHVETYTGWTAQIIQHEVDHLQGILI